TRTSSVKRSTDRPQCQSTITSSVNSTWTGDVCTHFPPSHSVGPYPLPTSALSTPTHTPSTPPSPTPPPCYLPSSPRTHTTPPPPPIPPPPDSSPHPLSPNPAGRRVVPCQARTMMGLSQ